MSHFEASSSSSSSNSSSFTPPPSPSLASSNSTTISSVHFNPIKSNSFSPYFLTLLMSIRDFVFSLFFLKPTNQGLASEHGSSISSVVNSTKETKRKKRRVKKQHDDIDLHDEKHDTEDDEQEEDDEEEDKRKNVLEIDRQVNQDEMKKKMKKKLKRAGLKSTVHGLYNLGNTCYFNSVIQSLSALSHLNQFLENVPSSAPIAYQLALTLEALRVPVAHSSSLSPITLMRLLNQKKPMINYDQQDAQELFQLVSSTLTEELPLLHPMFLPSLTDAVRSFDLPFSSLSSSPSTSTSTSSSSSVFSPRRLPFMGSLSSRLACLHCGYIPPIRHFLFDTISLPLPTPSTSSLSSFSFSSSSSSSSSDTVSLSELFQSFIALETLDDATCRPCSMRTMLQAWSKKASSVTNLSPGPLVSRLDKPHGTTSMEKHRKKKRKKRKKKYPPSSSPTASHTTSIPSSSSSSFFPSFFTPSASSSTSPTSTTSFHQELHHQIAWLQRVIQDQDYEKELPPTFPRLLKTQTPHTKQFMFSLLPPILVIHLNRSTMYGARPMKNHCQVSFPLHFNLAPYATSGYFSSSPSHSMVSQFLTQPCWYQLKACVVHYGKHSFGHYIAYRQHPFHSKVWFRISDTEVHKVSQDEVLMQSCSSVYMLFYEKIEAPESEEGLGGS